MRRKPIDASVALDSPNASDTEDETYVDKKGTASKSSRLHAKSAAIVETPKAGLKRFFGAGNAGVDVQPVADASFKRPKAVYTDVDLADVPNSFWDPVVATNARQVTADAAQSGTSAWSQPEWLSMVQKAMACLPSPQDVPSIRGGIANGANNSPQDGGLEVGSVGAGNTNFDPQLPAIATVGPPTGLQAPGSTAPVHHQPDPSTALVLLQLAGRSSESAYLVHLKHLVRHVVVESAMTRHLFTNDEQQLARAFLGLTPAAAGLLARAFQRRGPWFRVTSFMRYPELLAGAAADAAAGGGAGGAGAASSGTAGAEARGASASSASTSASAHSGNAAHIDHTAATLVPPSSSSSSPSVDPVGGSSPGTMTMPSTSARGPGQPGLSMHLLGSTSNIRSARLQPRPSLAPTASTFAASSAPAASAASTAPASAAFLADARAISGIDDDSADAGDADFDEDEGDGEDGSMLQRGATGHQSSSSASMPAKAAADSAHPPWKLAAGTLVPMRVVQAAVHELVDAGLMRALPDEAPAQRSGPGTLASSTSSSSSSSSSHRTATAIRAPSGVQVNHRTLISAASSSTSAAASTRQGSTALPPLILDHLSAIRCVFTVSEIRSLLGKLSININSKSAAAIIQSSTFGNPNRAGASSNGSTTTSSGTSAPASNTNRAGLIALLEHCIRTQKTVVGGHLPVERVVSRVLADTTAAFLGAYGLLPAPASSSSAMLASTSNRSAASMPLAARAAGRQNQSDRKNTSAQQRDTNRAPISVTSASRPTTAAASAGVTPRTEIVVIDIDVEGSPRRPTARPPTAAGSAAGGSSSPNAHVSGADIKADREQDSNNSSHEYHLVRVLPALQSLFRRAHGLFYIATATSHPSSGMGTGSWPVAHDDDDDDTANAAGSDEDGVDDGCGDEVDGAGAGAETNLVAACGGSSPALPPSVLTTPAFTVAIDSNIAVDDEEDDEDIVIIDDDDGGGVDDGMLVDDDDVDVVDVVSHKPAPVRPTSAIHTPAQSRTMMHSVATARPAVVTVKLVPLFPLASGRPSAPSTQSSSKTSASSASGGAAASSSAAAPAPAAQAAAPAVSFSKWGPGSGSKYADLVSSTDSFLPPGAGAGAGSFGSYGSASSSSSSAAGALGIGGGLYSPGLLQIFRKIDFSPYQTNGSAPIFSTRADLRMFELAHVFRAQADCTGVFGLILQLQAPTSGADGASGAAAASGDGSVTSALAPSARTPAATSHSTAKSSNATAATPRVSPTSSMAVAAVSPAVPYAGTLAATNLSIYSTVVQAGTATAVETYSPAPSAAPTVRPAGSTSSAEGAASSSAGDGDTVASDGGSNGKNVKHKNKQQKATRGRASTGSSSSRAGGGSRTAGAPTAKAKAATGSGAAAAAAPPQGCSRLLSFPWDHQHRAGSGDVAGLTLQSTAAAPSARSAAASIAGVVAMPPMLAGLSLLQFGLQLLGIPSSHLSCVSIHSASSARAAVKAVMLLARHELESKDVPLGPLVSLDAVGARSLHGLIRCAASSSAVRASIIAAVPAGMPAPTPAACDVVYHAHPCLLTAYRASLCLALQAVISHAHAQQQQRLERSNVSNGPNAVPLTGGVDAVSSSTGTSVPPSLPMRSPALSSHPWLHQFCPGSLYATLLWESIDPLERSRLYAHTIPFLVQLTSQSSSTGGRFTPHRCGRWWARMCLNLSHLGLHADAVAAADAALSHPDVRAGDRILVHCRAVRLRAKLARLCGEPNTSGGAAAAALTSGVDKQAEDDDDDDDAIIDLMSQDEGNGERDSKGIPPDARRTHGTAAAAASSATTNVSCNHPSPNNPFDVDVGDEPDPASVYAILVRQAPPPLSGINIPLAASTVDIDGVPPTRASGPSAASASVTGSSRSERHASPSAAVTVHVAPPALQVEWHPADPDIPSIDLIRLAHTASAATVAAPSLQKGTTPSGSNGNEARSQMGVFATGTSDGCGGGVTGPPPVFRTRRVIRDHFVRQPLNNVTGQKSRFVSIIDDDDGADDGYSEYRAGGEAAVGRTSPSALTSNPASSSTSAAAPPQPLIRVFVTPPTSPSRKHRDARTDPVAAAAVSVASRQQLQQPAPEAAQVPPSHMSHLHRNITDTVCSSFGVTFPRGPHDYKFDPVAVRGLNQLGGDASPAGASAAGGAPSSFMSEAASASAAAGGCTGTLRVGVEELSLMHYHDDDLTGDGGGWRGVHDEGGVVHCLFVLLMWEHALFPASGSREVTAEADVSRSNPSSTIGGSARGHVASTSDHDDDAQGSNLNPNVSNINISDTFLTPYQDAPLDLDSPGVFYMHRYSAIRARLSQVASASGEWIVGEIGRVWRRHYGQVARGMRWDTYPLQLLQLIAVGIGGPSLACLCDAMAWDHKHTSGGMPDLLLWRVTLPVADNDAAEVPIASSSADQAADTDGHLEGVAPHDVGSAHQQLNIADPHGPDLTSLPTWPARSTLDGAINGINWHAEGTNGSSSSAAPQLQRHSARIVLPHVRVRLVEVKGPRDTLSEKQHVWLRILGEAGVNAGLCKISEPVSAKASAAAKAHQTAAGSAAAAAERPRGGSAAGVAAGGARSPKLTPS